MFIHANLGDPLLQFMRREGTLMAPRWCHNGSLVPDSMADEAIGTWYGPLFMAETAQEAVAGLLNATALAPVQQAKRVRTALLSFLRTHKLARGHRAPVGAAGVLVLTVLEQQDACGRLTCLPHVARAIWLRAPQLPVPGVMRQGGASCSSQLRPTPREQQDAGLTACSMLYLAARCAAAGAWRHVLPAVGGPVRGLPAGRWVAGSVGRAAAGRLAATHHAQQPPRRQPGAARLAALPRVRRRTPLHHAPGQLAPPQSSLQTCAMERTQSTRCASSSFLRRASAGNLRAGPPRGAALRQRRRVATVGLLVGAAALGAGAAGWQAELFRWRRERHHRPAPVSGVAAHPGLPCAADAGDRRQPPRRPPALHGQRHAAPRRAAAAGRAGRPPGQPHLGQLHAGFLHGLGRQRNPGPGAAADARARRRAAEDAGGAAGDGGQRDGGQRRRRRLVDGRDHRGVHRGRRGTGGRRGRRSAAALAEARARQVRARGTLPLLCLSSLRR